MEFKYDVYLEIRGPRKIDRSWGTASLSKRLEDVVFPNPVVDGMRVSISLLLKNGQYVNGKASSVTNVARYEGVGQCKTFFNLITNIGGSKGCVEEFEELREELGNLGFTYKTVD